jgi:hypothetical protein
MGIITSRQGEIFAVKLRLPMCGARPLDRYLAPMCVALTGMIVATLLLLSWQERRFAVRARQDVG